MRFALFLPLLLTIPARACINDRDSDSLALQAQKLPETVRVITGRFERNPPLYYQMRIRRSLTELKKNPRNFGLYDDIAAAYDRLHQSDDALKIMAKKRALLPPFDAKNAPVKEAWYRYYANAGTFRAHRFLSQKSGDLNEMKTARAMIQRAIEIKPNAHFGREKYQFMAMDWIVAVKSGETIETLGHWIGAYDGWEGKWEQAGTDKAMKKATEGLSGLIFLGAAWQSVDVFEALAKTLEREDGVTLRHLALLRCAELLREGRGSLVPKAFNLAIANDAMQNSVYGNWTGVAVNRENRESVNDLFPKLRAESEVWSGQRSTFMLARLEKGSHPDTDSQFWQGWKPTAPPSLELDWANSRKPRRRDATEIVGFATLALCGVALIWLTLRMIQRTMRRRIAA